MVVDGCMSIVRPVAKPEPRITESEASGWGDY
jgi:hypothetical protein